MVFTIRTQVVDYHLIEIVGVHRGQQGGITPDLGHLTRVLLSCHLMGLKPYSNHLVVEMIQ